MRTPRHFLCSYEITAPDIAVIIVRDLTVTEVEP